MSAAALTSFDTRVASEIVFVIQSATANKQPLKIFNNNKYIHTLPYIGTKCIQELKINSN